MTLDNTATVTPLLFCFFWLFFLTVYASEQPPPFFQWSDLVRMWATVCLGGSEGSREAGTAR